MTNDEFVQMRNTTTDRRYVMCDKKAVAYTNGSQDRLANFKRLADLTGITPEQVQGIYFGKHVLGLLAYLGSGRVPSEGVESVCDDIQNYVDLIRGLFRERNKMDTGSVPGNSGTVEEETTDE